MSPSVTVLLPFHREGKWLTEAITSILDQTFSDFELLLLENHSDHSTFTIANEFAGKDKRVRIIPVKDRGIAFALNEGLKHARGEFIVRMDADDISVPRRLEKQAAYLVNHPDTGIVSCQAELFPVTPENEGYRRFVGWQNTIITPEQHFTNRFIESPVAHPSVMFRKSLMSKYGNYSTEAIPEDYELWLRWMNAGIRFHKLQEPLLLWRDHNERLSRNHHHYDNNAFFRVKSEYLAEWLKANVASERPLMVCGGSRNIRSRIDQLEKNGVQIDAITDIVQRSGTKKQFYEAGSLDPSSGFFIINLISKRDVRESIRQFLVEKGFGEMRDFILA